MTHPPPSRRRAARLLAAPLMLLAGGLSIAQPLPANWTSRVADGGTLYEPTDLPAGTVFNVWAPAPLPVGQLPLTQAFVLVKQQGLRGVDTAGRKARCEEAEESQGSVTQTCRLEGPGKPTLHLQYVMMPVRDGVAHSVRVLMAGDPTRVERHKTGFRAVIQLETQRWGSGVKTSPAARITPGTSASAPKVSSQKELEEQARRDARAAIARAVRSAPGKGLQQDGYDSVLFSWRQSLVNGAQHAQGTVYLLMKDGTAYRDLHLPPEDFNADASRRLQPERWVQWRKNGPVYEVRPGNNTPWQALKAWPAMRGKRNERLDNTYTNASHASDGDGDGGLGGHAGTARFVFRPDGRFEQIGQASSGASPGSTDMSLVVNATGHRRGDGAAHLGTYRIDAWTLELHRDNGDVERTLFLYTSDKRRGVNIAGQLYSPGRSP